ncbi:MAG: Spy/CpxP family protein refolding chaperone [Nitrospira sp.]|nr:Spy/CpxP family protein refolding chaperone [Nitrospira sp.]MCP9440978.1 Spy/CpxP family protein refolding chaperone [Nitrospira sp.]
MKPIMSGIVSVVATAAVVLTCGVGASWANEPGYGYGGHGKMGGYGKSFMHGGTGHLIRHLLKHEKDIGLTPDQVAKLKDLQLSLDKARIKAEAEIQITEREIKALIEDEKTDLAAIEAKLKQSAEQRVALRLTAIKMRRDVLGLLTPEQREKEKTEHEKVLREHGKSSYGGPHGGGTYGAYPHHKKNPYEGMEGHPPVPPTDMSVQ